VSEALSPLLPLEVPEVSESLALLQDRAGAYARASRGPDQALSGFLNLILIDQVK
jgi:hypothetical protein